MIHEPVVVNMGLRTVTVPHLGVTLRRLQGAVLAEWPEREQGEVRELSIKLHGATIGVIYVKAH